MLQNALFRVQAHPLRIAGNMMEARLKDVKIGELCEVYAAPGKPERVARAQVLGFREQLTMLSIMGNARGLSRNCVISPTGTALSIPVSGALKGCVLNARGEVKARLASVTSWEAPEYRPVHSPPLSWDKREGISRPFVTGIRAIDGLITCGCGQRMGIFAMAGCGKTTLMQMIISNARADVFVVALIGERGREVTEFVEELRASGAGARTIVIYATSDYSALERCNAAATATTVAEYFRDQGLDVVLFLDSVTRYARALRDVALASGELPARRGYPASVFEALPALLERPGNTHSGSITAFYTVLYENEDEPDPVAEEVRSILDGHIVLSRKLASRNHYPAIDVLRSVSRITHRICTPEHRETARGIRQTLACLEDMQLLIDLGEYRPGMSQQNDDARGRQEAINQFLCQSVSEDMTMAETLEKMNAVAP